MSSKNAARVALALLASFSTADAQVVNVTADGFKYINQLIGTDNGGNVFAGATLPYGMAKAVSDVSGQDTCGFATDGTNITGFSHMHDSGTGGQPSLGNFPLWPQTSCSGDSIDTCKFGSKYQRAVNYVNDSVVATPGYFAVGLENGISAEMTVSNHTALYNFNFPSNGTVSPLMILDLTDLADSRQNATVIVDPQTGRITGNGTFLPSFGDGSFVSFFCADFKGAAIRDTGIWVNDRGGTEPKQLFVTRGIDLFYIEAGGFVRFEQPTNNNTLQARVGMSFISIDKACSNAENEIGDWNFQRVHNAAVSAWEEKLSTVSIDRTGADDDLVTTFFSGMYRAMINPQDYTGENPLWQSNEPYFDSFYCIWDSFRAQHPFLTILDPAAQTRMVRSLIDTYAHLGWMPDCRMSLCKGFTQGGSNADVVVTDAYVKGLHDGIDWSLAYEAMKADAEHEPIDWSNEGRGGKISWAKYGYIPYLDYDYLGFGTNSRSISRTLEYAYNDYCLSVVAQSLRNSADHTTYRSRSGNWLNLFKANQTSKVNGKKTPFVGFPQPRYMNGTWGYQDPEQCSALDGFCSLTSNPQEVFESSVWEYQFYVPHDSATLVETLGGDAAFVKRLDFLHDSGLLDIGNEPSFVTCYLYHYAGRPGLSVNRAHQYIPSSFNATTTGLPGNDDSGAMGSFAALSMLGLFPIPGQSVYLITTPFFRSLSLRNPSTGKTATIRIANPDAFSADSSKLSYIQSATLNGKPYTKNWIDHSFFTDGKTLELTVGPTESKTWGTAQQDRPPSPAKGSAGTAGIYAVNDGGNATETVGHRSLEDMFA